MHVTGFTGTVSVNWSVSVSIFRFGCVCVCQFQFSIFSFIGLLLSIPSYGYVSLSVSKLRSLERGGVSELSQAQVDR
jgi:hypothetical protein